MSLTTIKNIIKTLLFSVIIFIPFLRIDSLYFPYISGKVYLFRLLVSISLFFWIWLMLKEKQYKPNFKNILIISLILFFIAQIFVSFFGVDPIQSLFSTIERGDGVIQYGFWILYFLMLVSVLRKKEDWNFFFYSFIIVAVLVSLYSWLNYSTQIRLSGIFGNPSYLAVYLIFAIGFSFIVLERKLVQSAISKYSVFLAILLFIVTLIATQTRGAYIGLAGGVFLFCLLSFLFLKKQNKKLSLYSGIILLIGIISVASLFLAKDSDFVQNNYILKRTSSIANLGNDDVVRERFLVWQIALKSFQDKPLTGWGTENFGSAANKNYDYRVGIGEPWFDRTHNYPLEILATGGIVLFSFYVFWLISVIYLIYRISRKEKILSYILIAIFSAYFLQGILLFDTLPTYLGLFPFLAFLVFCYNNNQNYSEKENHNKNINSYSLFLLAFISFLLVYTTVFIPYKANSLALKSHAHLLGGYYKESKQFLEESFNIKSPYTYWDVRKRAGWQFVNVLNYDINETLPEAKQQELRDLYDVLKLELERFAENKPYNSQIYFILGRFYRLGFEKLQDDTLQEGEGILRKSFNYSDKRIEYVNELVKILFLQQKPEEINILAEEYLNKIGESDDYAFYIIAGRLYSMANNHEKVIEYLEKARESGYKIYENETEYNLYMLAAEALGYYDKTIEITQKYLEEYGPKADTYFNLAVAYFHVGEIEKAKEYFNQALKLDPVYEEYKSFFDNL